MTEFEQAQARIFALALLLGCGPVTGAAQGEPVDFSHQIVPLLRQRCGECHLADARKGGFSMNTRSELLEGGESGPVLDAGKAAESVFLEVLLTEDAAIQMPPKGERLAAADVELLRRWIDQGLSWEPGFAFGESAWEPPLRPREVALPAPSGPGRDHPVDRLLDAHLAGLGEPLTDPVDDVVFLRRVYLDVIGLLPDAGERAAFLNDSAPDKRERLVDALLGRDIDYAEHWLTFWNDLLRNDYAGTGFIDGGRKQITGWLYRALADNLPYDQFVRELIAPGPDSEGFINGIKWRGRVNSSQTREIQFSENLSQVFLGINMKCASCHDSFIDRWKLADAYGLAAVFATEPLDIHRCDAATGETARAAWIFPELGELDPEAAQPERLARLAELMTHPDNGRFTRTLVNRVWHRLMGRGITHPVDAMHTRPWSEDLLDWLAADFAAGGYDLRALVRRVATSRAYQAPMAATPDEAEAGPYVYRGPLARRLTAEQFIDAVWRITGTAPPSSDAEVVRAKTGSGGSPGLALEGRWIWTGREGLPAAGEAISLRHRFVLEESPAAAFGVISADNAFTLWVNGRQMREGGNWMAPEAVDLAPALRRGSNEILVAARNAGSGPNPAAVYFEAWVFLEGGGAESREIRLASGEAWEWSDSIPDARGQFAAEPEDWQASRAQSGPWAERVGPLAAALLEQGAAGARLPARASLMKSDLLMRSLGRPNREQVVTTRPEQLSTLQAIDLANGEILSALLRRGAERLVAASEGLSPGSVAERVMEHALCRPPEPEERVALLELLGPGLSHQGVEDLLWTLFMLPEFQLVR